MMNMDWNGEPSPLEILKVMVAIPESFLVKELYAETPNIYNCPYTIKGLICFQAAHYLSFFRRIPIKLN